MDASRDVCGTPDEILTSTESAETTAEMTTTEPTETTAEATTTDTVGIEGNSGTSSSLSFTKSHYVLERSRKYRSTNVYRTRLS